MVTLPGLPGVEHEWVQAGEVRLHVARAGARDAPAVVLLHGWPQHWYAWRRVIPLLAGDFQVVAPDLRGFGWSDAPPGDYAKETLAGDVVALLGALGLDDVVLAGHDWGGFVGFLVCLRAPERVRGYLALSITSPWSRLDAPLRDRWRFLYQVLVAAPGLGAAVQRHTPFVDTIFRTQGGDRIWSAEEREAFVAPFRDPGHAAAASALYRTFLLSERAAGARGDWDAQELRVPSTLLLGRGDDVVTRRLVAGAERQTALRIEDTDGGHWLPEERPEAVAGHLRWL